MHCLCRFGKEMNFFWDYRVFLYSLFGFFLLDVIVGVSPLMGAGGGVLDRKGGENEGEDVGCDALSEVLKFDFRRIMYFHWVL